MRRPGGAGGGSRIHRGLTGERALVGTSYLADPELRRQYAAEIAPRTAAALARILDGLNLPAPRRALDLGAGTGAATAALRERFGATLEVVQVDRVAGPGIVAADLERGVPSVAGVFGLVVAAHVLGELFLGAGASPAERAAARAERVRAWCRAFLAPGGTMILIEPALRETSRGLLEVRDRLIAGAELRVVAPCFWAGPCPALARERDWCHDAAPPAVAGAPRVDFAYLALRRAAEVTPAEDATIVRVVSEPLVEKGRLRLFGCGPAGRHPFVRLDRQATPANAAFAALERGDVATIAGTTEAGDGRRVGPDASVQSSRGG